MTMMVKIMRGACSEEEEPAGKTLAMAAPSHLPPPPLPGLLIPGLPDEISMLCLARVPSLALLSKVSRCWRSLVCTSSFFHGLRVALGFRRHNWFYVLLHNKDWKRPASASVVGSSEAPCPALSLPAAASEAASPSLRSSSSSQQSVAATAAGGRPYTWHAWDALSGAWAELPAMPGGGRVEFARRSAGAIGREHEVQCASSGMRLFVVAGSVAGEGGRLEPALERPLIFDAGVGEWSEGPAFGVPRRWCVCGVVPAAGGGRRREEEEEEQLLVASGCGREWAAGLARATELYDLGLGRGWAAAAPLPTARLSGGPVAGVAAAGRQLLVAPPAAGGVGACYDPASREWADMPPGMRNGWTGPAVAVLLPGPGHPDPPDPILHVLDAAAGRLRRYDSGRDAWADAAVDPRLVGLARLTAGRSPGTFCGVPPTLPGVNPAPPVLRIVDIRTKPPRFLDVAVPAPPGAEIVAVHVLAHSPALLTRSHSSPWIW